jgi:hypothetical protein
MEEETDPRAGEAACRVATPCSIERDAIYLSRGQASETEDGNDLYHLISSLPCKLIPTNERFFCPLTSPVNVESFLGRAVELHVHREHPTPRRVCCL